MIGKQLYICDAEPVYLKRLAWICTGVCKRMLSNDNNWHDVWGNTRLCPIFGKKFRDIS